MTYYFKNRKRSLPYIKKNIEVQFYVAREDLDVKESIVNEDESLEEVIVKYAYDRYILPWREEFSQGAEYDEEGEITKQDYITEHFDELLEEAKQI